MRVLIPTLSESNPDQTEEELKAAVIESYNQLFADLDAEYRTFFASLNPALTVNSITSFYRGISEILKDGHVNQPKPRYFRLPLDEPQFAINMDSRVITVPKVFQDYGLGVKGDANAEIIFFTCDRYYDGVDLGAMTPGIPTSGDPSKYNCVVQWQNTGSGEAGNSQVILADTEDNSIVFGWMITSKMTDRPGTINFAVRWTQLDNEGQIIYSVSTQQATCAIKSTLDLDYDTIGVEDISDIVYSRPYYSGVVNSMHGSSPNIVTNLESSTRNLEPATGDDLENYPIATYPDGILKLSVDATSPDGYPVVYYWYNGDRQIQGLPDTQKTYVVTEPGYYHAKIGNDGRADNVGVRYVDTPTVTVPAPDDIKFEETRWFGEGTYSYPNNPNDANNNVHTPSVTVTNIKGQIPNGTLKYTWKRAPMLVNGAIIPVTDVADEAYIAVEGANGNMYRPTEDDEAYFKCEVVNKLNNTSSNVLKTSEPAVIRALPKAPNSVTIVFDQQQQTLSIQSINWGTAPGQYHADEIRYEWGSIDEGVYSVGFGNDHRSFSVAGLRLRDNNAWQSDFYCRVNHVVYRNNAGGQEQACPQVKSNDIQLRVQLDGNGLVTVVPVS